MEKNRRRLKPTCLNKLIEGAGVGDQQNIKADGDENEELDCDVDSSQSLQVRCALGIFDVRTA